MSGKALANPIFLESGKEMEQSMPDFRQLFKEWEMSVLVLLSLTFQLILVLLSNRRRYSKSQPLNAVLWAAYVAADSVATMALGVISTNLTVTEALDLTRPLDPRIELQTFWAPFFLLHLGGPDTITAFQMEDNELWRRHLVSLIVQTGLTLYILFRAWTSSTLFALSAMMLTAGSIKYAERTWSLWSASYEKRREKAEKAFTRNPDYKQDQDGEGEYLIRDDNDGDAELGSAAIAMFLDTESMFADVFVNRDKRYNQIVRTNSSLKVMRLIEIELKMMYDNLYTKTRVILSSTGLALRFISLLLTCITLILFSSSKKMTQHIRDLPEYPLTFLLLVVSISLELHSAMLWLTLYRTIFEHFPYSSKLKSLASWLRGPDWSNSMGQFSTINYFLQEPHRIRRNKMSQHHYHRQVPDKLKQFIHGYLIKASGDEKGNYSQHPLLQSRGRVPWSKFQGSVQAVMENLGQPDLSKISVVFEKELGEMIAVFHFVTEVCFYLDRQHVVDKDKDTDKDNDIFLMSRVSKHLSRYLMHLFVASSDLLPQRTPLSKTRLFEQLQRWEDIGIDIPGDEDAAEHDKEKKRANKVRVCQQLRSDEDGAPAYLIQVGHNLLKHIRPETAVDQDQVRSDEDGATAYLIQVGQYLWKNIRTAVDQDQLKRRWELLSGVWVELLVHAADQCKGKAHAQHLRQGGELLTHVWVLLGHLSFIDDALLPEDVLHFNQTQARINNISDNRWFRWPSLRHLPDLRNLPTPVELARNLPNLVSEDNHLDERGIARTLV